LIQKKEEEMVMYNSRAGLSVPRKSLILLTWLRKTKDLGHMMAAN
jgi:hypothetical protein